MEANADGTYTAMVTTTTDEGENTSVDTQTFSGELEAVKAQVEALGEASGADIRIEKEVEEVQE